MNGTDIEGQQINPLKETYKEQKNETVPLLERSSLIITKEDTNTASYLSGVFNLSCTIVGAGIMSLPAAMKVLGIIPGLLLIVASGVLAKYTIDILLRYSEAEGSYTYGQLMYNSFGRFGEIMFQISVVINNLGINIIYLIIIADVVSGSSVSGTHHSGVLEEWFGEQWWTGRAFVLVFLTAFVLVPTAWIKRMVHFCNCSGLAVFFILIVIEITAYRMAKGTIQLPAFLPRIDDFASFWNLFTAVPVLVCAYLCHFNVHTIRNELQEPSQMPGVVKSSLAVCSTIYIMTGLFGFLLFGDSTASDVLSNFDSDLGVPYSSVLNALVRLSYAAHIVLVFPVVFYALRLNFYGLVYNSAIPLTSDTRRFEFAIITLSLILIILLGAIFIPSIWVAFQFTGATAGALILFIFPASIVLRDHLGISTRKDVIISWGLIILAVFSDLMAIYSNAVSLLQNSQIGALPHFSCKMTVINDEKVPLLGQNRASFGSSVFNLSCTIVGAGIMSLPAAIKVLGVIPGALLIIVAGFLTEASIEFLIRFSDASRSVSYCSVMEDAYGKFGKILVQLSVVVNNIGISIIYLIIIEDVLSGSSTSSEVHHPGVLEEWFGQQWWTEHSLRYTSAIAVALAVFFIVVVVAITAFKLVQGTIQQPAWFPQIDNLESFWNLFTAVPVLVCAYLCHFNVYLLTGLFGFLLFGDSTASDILSNFDTDLGIPYSWLLNNIVRVSYAGHIILVFPIIFYSLRLNFDGLMFRRARPLASDCWRFAFVTLLLMSVILYGAIFIPSIWIAFEFTGATAGSLLLDCHGIATSKDRILAIFMIVVAVFANVIAIYSNASSLIPKRS
ncbi:Amino acid transporter AVT6B [Bienertia sinuspersici]